MIYPGSSDGDLFDHQGVEIVMKGGFRWKILAKVPTANLS
jgi:hypothetical protein